MKYKLLLNISLLLIITILASGCAFNRATANIAPNANLASIKSIHVTKFAPDGREINILIANKLKEIGYQVTSGVETPEGVDAIVTYKDKWIWDLTMYMIELTIKIRDPKNNFPLASGNSYHTSLTRKTPAEMVNEVINSIFNKHD
ncbi:MAG: hypothetical protein ABFS18_00505 [Thermodesulfobacteriota bacterium]